MQLLMYYIIIAIKIKKRGMFMGVNDRIKQRRLELKLSLKDVATALGVAESTVSRYETKDIQNMGIDKVEALAKVLDCSPGYLMGWEEKSETPKLDEYQEKNKILFSKYEKLKDEDKAIIEQMIERFEKETQD